jgi:ATP-binding cassette subfamily B protein RaxB
VLHWDLNHFVVLKEVSRGWAVIHDPARGVRRLPLAEVSKHFTGIVLELTPQAEFKPHTERRSVSLRQLLGRVTGLRRSLLQIFTLAIALEGFMLLTPFFMQWVVDNVLVSLDRDLLVTLGLGFGLLGADPGRHRRDPFVGGAAPVGDAEPAVARQRVRAPDAACRSRGSRRRPHRRCAVALRRGAADSSRPLTTSFIEAVLDGLLVVVTLVMMLIYSGTSRRSRSPAWPATRCCAGRSSARCARRPKSRSCSTPKKSSHFLESLRGVQSIKLFNRQEDRQARFMNLVVDSMNANIATRKLDLTLGVLHKLLFGLERVVMIWVGALLVMDHTFSVGMLFAFVAYKEQFAQRVSALIDKTVEVKMLKLQGERLADIVLSAPEPQPEFAPRATRCAARPRVAQRQLRVFRHRTRGAAFPEPEHRARRVGRDRRPVGLRQDDAAEADARRARAAQRRHPDRRYHAGAARPARLGAT